MAVQSGPASSEKKSSNGVNELLTFNAENMQSNMKIIYYRFGCTFLILDYGTVWFCFLVYETVTQVFDTERGNRDMLLGWANEKKQLFIVV
jgi:hypothetical protein